MLDEAAAGELLTVLQSIDQTTQSIDQKLSIIVGLLLAAAFSYFAIRWFYE